MATTGPEPGPGLADTGSTRSWHDMGGLDAGRLDQSEHDHELWEKRVDALLVLLNSRGLFSVDALRRALEDLGEDAFETMSYYERWIAAVARNLVEVGVLTAEEISRRMEEVQERGKTYGEASAVEASR